MCEKLTSKIAVNEFKLYMYMCVQKKALPYIF